MMLLLLQAKHPLACFGTLESDREAVDLAVILSELLGGRHPLFCLFMLHASCLMPCPLPSSFTPAAHSMSRSSSRLLTATDARTPELAALHCKSCI